MTSLRVLHVVPHLDRVGGYERQAVALARAQHRHPDTEPILLTHAEPGPARVQPDGVGTVVRLPRGLRRHHPGAWWQGCRARPDVVHAHAMHKLSGQLVALARDAGLPALVKVATADDVRMFAEPGAWEQVLDGDEDAPRGLRWRRMARAAFRRLCRANLFLALNADIEDELRRHGLPCERVNNGVDVARFRPPSAAERAAAREALGLPADAFVIAAVGRLATRKDHATLVDAFGRLAATRPHARLVLVGDGPRREALGAQLAAGGHGAAAALLGELDDVRPVLWAADVFAHPSRREGQPNAVLEAWACGLPAVLSDIGAHRGLVEPREVGARAAPPASLVTAGDAVAFADALGRLADDERLRAGAGDHARRRAAGRFALEVVAARYRGLYARLAGAGRGRRRRDGFERESHRA